MNSSRTPSLITFQTPTRVSPRELAEVLQKMDTGPLCDIWRADLGRGGERGSLRRRFQETSATRALAPRILGKTGTLGGVRSLAGIILRNDTGPPIYFAAIVNHFPRGKDDEVLAFLDQIALTLAAD